MNVCLNQFGAMMKFLTKSKVAIALAVIILPTSSFAQMTSGFGVRADPFHGKKRKHSGVDIAKPTGTPIYATANGHVGRSGRVGSYGNLVEINHGNGYQTRYAHMHRIFVRSGQYVQRGTQIGEVGSTGRSTGPHLHYEVRYRGKPQDPTRYIAGR